MLKFMQRFISIAVFYVIYVSANAAEIDLISVSSSGVQGNSYSSFESISADGQLMTFSSISRNLHPDDRNDELDVFIHDRINGTTELVSIATDGTQGDSYSNFSSISADGRFITFSSDASNLVSEPDIAFNRDVFLRDIQLGITTRINPPGNPLFRNTSSVHPSISADGRFTAFSTSNLTPGNGAVIMVYDRITDTRERIEIPPHRDPRASYYSSYPSINADGRYVTFITQVYVIENNTLILSEYYLYLYDRISAELQQINDDLNAKIFEKLAISDNGQYVVYTSGNELNRPFRRNIQLYNHKTGVTKKINNPINGGVQETAASFSPGISGNGRFIVFNSELSNLIEDDTNNAADIFVYDQLAQVIKRVNVNPDDSQAENTDYPFSEDSASPSISSDGEFIGFSSELNTLVDNDTNHTRDAFLAKNPLKKIKYNLSVALRKTSGTVTVGNYIRFRAKFTNNSNVTLTNCKALLVNPKINYQRKFSYYTWPLGQSNPALNAGIDLAPGDTGQMILAVLPRVALRQEVRFRYVCDNDHHAYTIPFINTAQLSAKTEPAIAEDFIQLKNNSNKTAFVIDRSNGKYWTPFVINVSNTGSAPTSVALMTTSDIPSTFLRESLLCEPVDPTTGNWSCITPRDTQIQVELTAGESKKILLFFHAKQPIDPMPVANRVYVEARDGANESVAKHSIGVSTIN